MKTFLFNFLGSFFGSCMAFGFISGASYAYDEYKYRKWCK